MIIEFLQQKGFDITWDDIADEVYLGNFRYLFKYGESTGFYTWKEIWNDSKLYVFINNMCCWEKSNLLSIRKFLRERYPDAEYLYWHSKKHDRFFYSKERIKIL